MTVSRRWNSRSVVAASCGAVVGKTWITPTRASEATGAAAARATPGSPFSAVASAATGAWSPGAASCTATYIGPLTPGPKPSAVRS